MRPYSMSGKAGRLLAEVGRVDVKEKQNDDGEQGIVHPEADSDLVQHQPRCR